MRILNPSFQVANSAPVRRPRIVAQIIFDLSSPTLTSHDGISSLPGTAIEGVISGASSVSQEIFPDEGRATIGSVTLRLTNRGDPAITDALRDQLLTLGQGIRDREVRIWVGFSDDFEDFELVATAYADDVAVSATGYTIRCRDKSKALREQIFERKVTRLAGALQADDETIPAQRVEGFQMVPHTAAFNDAPSQTVGYLRIKDTGEIVRYTGIDAGTGEFTGCTRGVFGTRAMPVDVDPTTGPDRWPEIEEFIYLEGPGPAIAIAVMTGILDVDDGSVVLPSHWHLGLDWDADFNKPQWLGIGPDLWDPKDLTAGFPVRFTHLERTDGKRFIETEIYLLLGLMAPVDVHGSIGLRRVNRVIRQGHYTALLDMDTVTHVGDLRHDQRAVANQYQIDYNYDGDDLTRQVFFSDLGSISRHKEAPVRRLEFKGLHTARHTERAIRERIGFLRDRYADPPIRLQVTAAPSMNAFTVGDIVRVALPTLEDYTAEDGSLDRDFEIQRVSVDWTTGRVDFNLFGTSRDPEALGQNDTDDPVLEDDWYTQAGTDIATLAGYDSGVLDGATLAGGTDINAPASIWYHEGDLDIVDCTLTGNVQLRVRGFLQIEGTVDGRGGGRDGVADTDTRNTASTAWARPGVPGWHGVTRAQAGIWKFGETPNTDLTTDTVTPITEGQHPAVPPLELEVLEGELVTELPADLRGTSGGSGGQCIIKSLAARFPLNQGGTIMATGGAGGKSGAGLAITCRGLGFGVNGRIDLSGAPGTPGEISWPHGSGGEWVLDLIDESMQHMIDFPIRGGTGAGGGPGALYLFLDGDGVLLPDINDTTLRAEQGATPLAEHSYAPVARTVRGNMPYPSQMWPGALNLGRGVDQTPVWYLTGFREGVQPPANYWVASHRVQWLPNTGQPELELPRAPWSLEALGGGGHTQVHVEWAQRAGHRLEIWAGTTNDRAFAQFIGETTGGIFTHTLPNGGTRFYWARVRAPDGRLSSFFPSSPTAGIEGKAEAIGDAITPPVSAGSDAWVIGVGAAFTGEEGGFRFGSVTGGVVGDPEAVTIAVAGDDGSETGTTWDPDLVRVGFSSSQTVLAGLSFAAFPLMPDEIIEEATLRLYITDAPAASGWVTVQAEKSLVQSQPSSGNRPSQWSLTTAAAFFSTAAGTIDVDVKSIVQEVIGQEHWQAGRLNFVLTPPEVVWGPNEGAELARHPSSDRATLILKVRRSSGVVVPRPRRGPAAFDWVVSPKGQDIFDVILEVRRDPGARALLLSATVEVSTADSASTVFLDSFTDALDDVNCCTDWRELQLTVPVISDPLGAAEPRPHYIRVSLGVTVSTGGYVYVRRVQSRRRENLSRIYDAPVFDDDAAAGAAGMQSGDLYRTPAGDLKLKL